MKMRLVCIIKTAGLILFSYLLYNMQQQSLSSYGELKFATLFEKRRKQLAETMKERTETVEETCKKYREDEDNVYIMDRHRNRNAVRGQLGHTGGPIRGQEICDNQSHCLRIHGLTWRPAGPIRRRRPASPGPTGSGRQVSPGILGQCDWLSQISWPLIGPPVSPN